MDNQRFDALARAVSGKGASRRGVLRRGAVAAAAALFGRGLLRREAAADHCDYIGCGCATGVWHACGNDLVCCPSSPGTPGGAGVCAPASECGGGQCTYWGDACPGYCNWGDSCPGCCSGYCGNLGQCAQYGYGL